MLKGLGAKGFGMLTVDGNIPYSYLRLLQGHFIARPAIIRPEENQILRFLIFLPAG